jgi:signal transduction histidine kinase
LDSCRIRAEPVKRGAWFFAVRRIALLAVMCAACASAMASAASADEVDPIELRAGRVATSVDGVTQEGAVTLPYNWDRQHGGKAGFASFELPFKLDDEPETPWGIFIPRTGNVFDVWLNGALLQVYGDLDRGNGADYAKAPVYLPVPGRLLHAGDNLLQVRSRADSGRRGGLSPVTLGPAAELRTQLFEAAYAWRFTGSVLLTAFSLILGGIALSLWLTQVDTSAGARERREGIYLWAALAEFCWALRVADGVIAEPPLSWGPWGVLMAMCYAGWIASAMMFCYHVAGWDTRPGMRWIRWPMVVIVFGTLVSSCLSMAVDEPQWLTRWLAIEIGILVVFVGGFAVAAVRKPDVGRLLVMAAAVVSIAFGTRDWLVIRISDSYGGTTWVRYSSVFFGIALLLIVLRRFRAASAQARGWVTTLAARVAEREQELESTYGKLEKVAREQARTHERERILRDMHDGVGSHISAAIRQLQSGQASDADVLRTLRDSLDQLKLSIDSIHLPPGDVGALLAGMRYRMTPRFTASGIALEWAVDDVTPVAALDGQAMRQVQLLLFEAISNVLQHSGASVLRLEAAMHGAVLRLRVIDNGCGFDALQVPRSLGQRAGALGVVLSLESRPGRTVVSLEFIG